MAVNYTISWQDKFDDGQRSVTRYQCPLCGEAYDIDKNLSDGYQVTDNCDCHELHRPSDKWQQEQRDLLHQINQIPAQD